MERYCESFYWALATFLLVGSKGDTIYETVFCITILLVTISAFAYILSTIGSIIDEVSYKSKEYTR